MLASPSTSGQLSQFGASLYGQQSKNSFYLMICFMLNKLQFHALRIENVHMAFFSGD